MSTDLKVGDEVYIDAGIEPKLTFVIAEFQKYGDDLLACGEYGCTHVDLLKKVEPADDYDQIKDELFIPYRSSEKK